MGCMKNRALTVLKQRTITLLTRRNRIQGPRTHLTDFVDICVSPVTCGDLEPDPHSDVTDAKTLP
jgi:hypothetical protein